MPARLLHSGPPCSCSLQPRIQQNCKGGPKKETIHRVVFPLFALEELALAFGSGWDDMPVSAVSPLAAPADFVAPRVAGAGDGASIDAGLLR